MEEELKYINVSKKRFDYFLPMPTTRHIHKVGLYAPTPIIEKYYRSFSTHIKMEDVTEYKKGKVTDHALATMVYMSLLGDNNFTKSNIVTYMESHQKLFYDCKIFNHTVSSTKLIIDPIKIKGYESIRKKYNLGGWSFMKWVNAWCKKQTLGSEVYLFENAYTPKIRFYLLTHGYDYDEENLFVKKSDPPKAHYIYL